MGQTGRLALALAVALWTGAAAAGLRIASSSASLHLARESATYFAQDSSVATHAVGGGTDAAIRAVRNGEADMAIAARELQPQERSGMHSRLLGHDGIVLIVHGRNPLGRITTSQVHDVFEGRLSAWSEFGDGPSSGVVVPVLRSPTRAARQIFDNHFRIAPLLPPRSVELGSDLAVLLYVSSDPQAIGYVSIAMLTIARQHGLKVKGLMLDGAEPTAAGCVARTYPLCRPLLAVTRGAPGGPAKQFLDFLLSPAGRELTIQHGFALPAESGR